MSSALVALALVLSACGGGDDRRPAPAAPSPAPEAGAERRSTVAPAASPWPHAKVLERIAGQRVRVGGDVVRVDPGTVTCGGVGPASARVGGQDAWTRFRCVQPTFPPDALAGPDVVFIVEPRDDRAYAVTRARYTRY